jgi:hypothetical protein
MAARRFEQFQLSLEKKVVSLWGKVAIGSTGAPTINAAQSQGIKSITRNSAGNYTVTLQNTYQRILFFDVAIVLASGAPVTSSGSQFILRSDSTNTEPPTFVIENVNNAGTAAELVSGTTVLFLVQLKNSSV